MPIQPQLQNLQLCPVWQQSAASVMNETAAVRQHPAARQSAVDAASADVVIVGGGLTGLSAAYHLLCARPRTKVVLLESHAIGHGASTRNSGMLTPGVGQSLATLVNRYGPEQAKGMYTTSLQAVDYLDELCQREQMDVGLRMAGQLMVARGRAGRRRLGRQAKLMRKLDLPCRPLDDSELGRRLCISLDAPGGGPAALQLPVAGVLDPGRLVSNLAAAVRRRGGKIIEHAPVAEVTSGGVRLADGATIRAGKVVLATNGYDQGLSHQKGRLIPLHLRMIATRPLDTAELASIRWRHREGVIDSRRAFNYFRLTDDNRILMGGGLPRYQWRGDVEDIELRNIDVDRLSRDLRTFFPGLGHVEIERTWTGVIAYTLDTLPVIGWVGNHTNALHVGGWCGHGIALSVYSGRWVTEMLTGNSPINPDTDSFPWFRTDAPRIPTEFGRWSGVRLGGWATQLLDRVL